ncbi:MAG: hypothetical protein WCO28_12080 [Bacteroidota bacterium]
MSHKVDYRIVCILQLLMENNGLIIDDMDYGWYEIIDGISS